MINITTSGCDGRKEKKYNLKLHSDAGDKMADVRGSTPGVFLLRRFLMFRSFGADSHVRMWAIIPLVVKRERVMV